VQGAALFYFKPNPDKPIYRRTKNICHEDTKTLRKNNKYILSVLVPWWQKCPPMPCGGMEQVLSRKQM